MNIKFFISIFKLRPLWLNCTNCLYLLWLLFTVIHVQRDWPEGVIRKSAVYICSKMHEKYINLCVKKIYSLPIALLTCTNLRNKKHILYSRDMTFKNRLRYSNRNASIYDRTLSVLFLNQVTQILKSNFRCNKGSQNVMTFDVHLTIV